MFSQTHLVTLTEIPLSPMWAAKWREFGPLKNNKKIFSNFFLILRHPLLHVANSSSLFRLCTDVYDHLFEFVKKIIHNFYHGKKWS
jgi:hypothetical protein